MWITIMPRHIPHSVHFLCHLISVCPKHQNSVPSSRSSHWGPLRTTVATLTLVAKRPKRFLNPHVPHPSPQPFRWSSAFPASVTEGRKLVFWRRGEYQNERERERERKQKHLAENIPQSIFCHGSQIVKPINKDNMKSDQQ